MKNFTLILGQHAPYDYPENNWQLIFNIDNKEDLLEALKEGYLYDAHNRNDYPLCSFDLVEIYTYDNLSEYDHPGSLAHFDLRNYNSNLLSKKDKLILEDTFKKFEKWKNKIQTLIPRLREKAKKIKNENYERKKLAELANKYGYKLIKE